jgi:uncharacterized protein with HEPN domain
VKPADRDFLFYLEDIRIAINKIQECIQKFTDYSNFENDWVYYDAVLRNLEVIGEAANQVPEFVKGKFTDIPWSDMYRTRNILIHNYFGIDSQIVWSIATVHLPQCLPLLETVIKYYKSESDDNIL